MTKKLFIATAKIVANAKSIAPANCDLEVLERVYGSEELRIKLAKEFATLFASENPRFNRHRFLSACAVRQDYGQTTVES